jgi:hypothetical protein
LGLSFVRVWREGGRGTPQSQSDKKVR